MNFSWFVLLIFQGIILVYDITTEDSFKHIAQWLQNIQDVSKNNTIHNPSVCYVAWNEVCFLLAPRLLAIAVCGERYIFITPQKSPCQFENTWERCCFSLSWLWGKETNLSPQRESNLWPWKYFYPKTIHQKICNPRKVPKSLISNTKGIRTSLSK